MSDPLHAVKELAWSHWRLLSEGKLEESLAVLNDRGTWWNLDRRSATPMHEFKDLIRRAMGKVELRFTLHRAIAEADEVLLELESHADLPDGEHYNNVYCFVVTVWGDSILHVREYFDSKHLDVLLRVLRSEPPPTRE